jgi:hypothetical protein
VENISDYALKTFKVPQHYLEGNTIYFKNQGRSNRSAQKIREKNI